MSVDLVVAQGLSSTPQPIRDANGNASGLYLTNAATGTTSLTSSGKLVFGLASPGGHGEWIQNSAAGTPGNGGIAFYGGSAEWMRLTSDGNLGVRTKNPAATVDVAGTLKVINPAASPPAATTNSLSVSGAVSFPGLQIGSGSDLVRGANGALAIQTSSAPFKENIRELKEDFGRILSLIPVSFTYKDSGQEAIGYTAEELHEKELLHLVTYDEEGKPFSVNYKLLPVYLVEIVKKQQEMIARLEQGLAQVLGGFAPAAEPAAG